MESNEPASQEETASAELQECPHTNLRKEIYMGQRSGDYECISCGEVLTPAQRNAIISKTE